MPSRSSAISGTPVAGVGSTETPAGITRLSTPTSIGPAHASVLYSNGGNGTSILGNAVGANVGATYKGFSLDGYYTKENGAVGLGTLPGGTSSTALTASLAWRVTARTH